MLYIIISNVVYFRLFFFWFFGFRAFFSVSDTRGSATFCLPLEWNFRLFPLLSSLSLFLFIIFILFNIIIFSTELIIHNLPSSQA